jgi:uncharacterized protein with NAD-binding domain and iron-sulfur cluster
VIELGFMRTKRDSAMVISRVGLSDLYTGQAQSFVEDRGGEVRLNADVARIEFEGGRATGVTLRSGERIGAEAVISAVPYFALRRMLPAELAAAHFPYLDRFKSAPVVSINLWYDEPITDLEFAGLLDSPIEWVFNKNAISGAASKKPQHLALVISGAHEFADRPKEELMAMAANEMRRVFPAARSQHAIHSVVVREHDATISHTVGTAPMRPSQRTQFENFFLAGDWTDTGLPATIEGAVWSGQECAQIVLNLITD